MVTGNVLNKSTDAFWVSKQKKMLAPVKFWTNDFYIIRHNAKHLIHTQKLTCNMTQRIKQNKNLSCHREAP